MKVLPQVMMMLCLLASPSPAFAWGAFSFDRLEGTVQSCTTHESEANASTCTMAHCQGDCSVLATFDLTCAAVAFDATEQQAYVAVDPSERSAREQAIILCGQSGGNSCALATSACDVRP